MRYSYHCRALDRALEGGERLPEMSRHLKILLGATLAVVVTVFLFPAIPQNEAYHNFADKRALLGIPNFLNVASNVFFFLVGVSGMALAFRTPSGGKACFIDSRERWPYFAFFLGVAVTAFGSAWYHLNPNDTTLVWDRIPMAIGFMALIAAAVAERISVKAGVWLLGPLVALGIATVVYWSATQSNGHGDLRPYAVTQFGGLLVLALIIALFPARYTRGSDFVMAFGFYVVAKIFEAGDHMVFSLAHLISGHTMKHIVAALSVYWILRMLRLRAPVSAALS